MKPTVPDDGALQQQIGTAYDTVKLVADSLPAIYAVLDAVDTITGSYVLKTTTVNNKPLSSNINLNATDVGARASTWVPTWAEVASKPTSMAQLGFSLLNTDIPSLDTSKLTTGLLVTARGGTGRADNKSAALITPVTITIGSTGKSFDGSAAVAWTLAELGAQAVNTNLTSFSALSGVADRVPYFTGPNTVALTNYTAFARSMDAAVDAAAVNTLLGVRTKAELDTIADFFTRATLDYDFANAVYKEYKNKYVTELPLLDAVTCARNSTATADHPFGVVTYDINEPRVQYNPLTGARLGLLAEEVRTNLLNYSSDFTNAIWTKRAGSAVTANTILAPDGTVSADTHTNTDTASNGSYLRYIGIYSTDNTVYTSSAFLKRGSKPTCELILYSRLGSSSNLRVNYNFDTDSVVVQNNGSVSGGTGGIIKYPDGWIRIWGTFNCLAGSEVAGLNIIPCLWGIPAAIGSEFGYVWGAQVEAGSILSSYIPTTTAALQRLFALQTLDSLPAQLNLLKEYTVYLEFTASDDIVLFGAGNTFNDCFYIANKQLNIRSGGNSVPVMNITFTYGARTKVAFRVKASDYSAVYNGILGGSNTSSFAPPVGLVRATVGSAPWETVPSLPNQANMILHRVAVLASALTNAEMQLLTK